MSDPNSPRSDKNAARNRAQNHFTQSERRDEIVRQEVEKERAALAARTAKLRALRLAKEAEDKIEADKAAAAKLEAKAAAKPRARRTPK